MPRRTAAERHTDSAPSRTESADKESVGIDELVAFHHPVRRRLMELLGTGGPATVGQLAGRMGLAAGSASHHLKVLHRAGLIEPAPELARDTRESWWRVETRTISWDVADWPAGSVDRMTARSAERAMHDFNHATLVAWLRHREQHADPWGRDAGSSSTLTMATRQQTADLSDRLAAVVHDWSEECRRDKEIHPDAPRRPVRATAAVYPDVQASR